MATRKKTEPKTPAAPAFTKEQLLAFSKYCGRRDLLGVLLTVAVPLIYAGLQSGGDPEHREHLANILAILQRGMAAKSKREENE